MSLSDVILDPLLIAEIYRQPLIQTGNTSSNAALENEIIIPYLGNNKQRWLLLINNPEEAYLQEGIFNMLLKLLNACKFTLDDIALVNMAHLENIDIPVLRKKFAPAKIILFGKALDEFTTGHLKNTKWEENGIHFLYTDTLKDMHAEQQLKLPFWNALKGFLFS